MTMPDPLADAARLLTEAMLVLDRVIDHTTPAERDHHAALAAVAHAQHALDTVLHDRQSGLPSLSR